MSKQVRRWVALGLFGAVVATVFVLLGQWQLHRLEERRARNSAILAHEREPVVPYTERMNHVIGEDYQWYRVSAAGVFEPQQFQVRYRSLEGVHGSEVVGVLRTDQGHLLLVNRGFMPRDPGKPDGEMPPVQQGRVSVTGYVRRNERGDEAAMTPHDSQIRLINSEALGETVGTPLIDGYVARIDSSPPQPAFLRPMGRPTLDEGNHLSYALQWFAFTVIAAVGFAVLIRADIRDRRQTKARVTADRADDAG